jgi:hypothetical protein
VFESFERENGRVIVFPSSVVGSDNASAVSEKWRDQKMSQKFAPEVGTSRGGPAWKNGLFERRGLFVVRFFNATKYGKSQKRPAGRQFPLDSAKERGKACLPRARPLNRHAGVCRRGKSGAKIRSAASAIKGGKSRTKRN